MADNADSVVLSLTVRSKVSSDATLLRLLPSENRFKQETIHSLGYIIYTLSSPASCDPRSYASAGGGKEKRGSSNSH